MTTRGDGPTLGLAIIAKDEEESLPRLLESIEGVFDQVVLVDTGSSDATEEVFCRWADRQPTPFAWKCERFEWVHDFSKARQFSWDLLETDWGVWADCDDTIQNAAHLRALAENAPPTCAGFLFPYAYAHDPHGNVMCRLERERLVRHGIGERWDLPIHEVLHVPGQLARSEAVVWVHHKKPENADPERNYKILQADLERSETAGEDPNPRTIIYLGTELLALNRPAEAITWLRRYLDVGEWDEELCQAAHKLSLAHRLRADEAKNPLARNVELKAAEEAGRLAIQHRPDWPEGYLDLAEIAMRRDQPDKALRLIEQAKLRGTPQTLLITNPLDYTLHPMLLESGALAKLGRAQEAFDITMEALKLAPRDDIKAQASGLADVVKVEDTVATVLKLRELLCRHDETLKALELLEAVPYYAYDHPAICAARLDQREMVLHATDPDLYSSYYRANPTEAAFEDRGVTVEDAHEYIYRLRFLRDGLADQRKALSRQNLKVLDLSGSDGWLAANIAGQGYDVDMVEMNPDGCAKARERKKRYARIGEVVCASLFDAPDHLEPGSYDAVVCFETIEHVPDPGALLDVMMQMVKPDGRCYVTTPDGAFERGRDPVMTRWHVVEQKGHLRAIRPEEMAGWLCERGVIEAFELEQRLIHACWRPEPRKGRIVFYAGGADALPEKITTEGLGGSETALCKLAEQFARKGYDVRVFAGQGDGGLRGDRVTTGEEGLTGQVLYAPGHAWDPGLECDLFISSRIPEAFDRTIKADRSLLWLHDADYGERITPERVERISDVLVLSQFQRDLFAKRYPFMADKLVVSSNAIEPLFFVEARPLTERKPWVVYSSSPDRGLDVLLECWPAIKERVPDAELHHGYAPYWDAAVKAFPYLKAFASKIERLRHQDGVVSFGSLPQQELAKLYCAARVWVHPSWTGHADDGNGAPFPEISCIAAMEAQAGGCVPVCADYAALQETVTSGTRIPGDTRGEDWRARFIEAVVEMLTDDKGWQEASLRGRTTWITHGWDLVADEWECRFVDEAEPVVLAA